MAAAPKSGRVISILLLVVLAAAAIAAPAGEAAKKKRKRDLPTIDFAVAVYEEAEGTVGIGVKVRRAEHVTVDFGGSSQAAVPSPGQDWWWDARFAAPVRQCYPIVVRATSRRGVVTRSMGAGMVGTPGCGGFGRVGGAR